MDPKSSSASSNNRLHGIDLLRALAILFVLMNHVNVRLSIAKVPFKQGLPHGLLHALFQNGQNGVRIFFAISGFLITSMSIRRWGSLARIRIRRFYWLRFARIAPLLLLLLAVLSALHFAHFKDFAIPAQRGGFAKALLAALTFHINWRESRTGYLPGNWDVLWSLSVEEVFYLGFPLVCRVAGARKALIAILCVFVAIGPFARHGNTLWSGYAYLSGMDAIALGCLTALFLAGRTLSPRWARASGIAGAALLVLTLCFSVPALDRFELNMTVLALGTCLFIVPAAQSRGPAPHAAAPLLALGQHSYEIYLTHMFVVFAFFNTFIAAGKPLWALPLLFVTVILCATLLGALTAKFYSEPMNHWLRARSGSTS